MPLRRVIWFLVFSLALLIVVMMITFSTYPKAFDGASAIGSYLRKCASEPCP
jgi:hypothetical protein